MATKKHTARPVGRSISVRVVPEHLFAPRIIDQGAMKFLGPNWRGHLLGIDARERQELVDERLHVESSSELDTIERRVSEMIRQAVSEVEAHDLITRIREDVRARGSRGGAAR